MATKIQVRRDTAANWTSANTVLSDGEMGYETDTGYMKIGDGATAWSSLAYFTPGDVSDDNTTYTISVAQAGADANVTLTGSDASNDTVTMVAGNNLTVTVAGDNVTMDVDTDLANYSNATTAFISNITAEAIGSLTDVDVSAVADGSVLAYDQGSGNWVAGDPAVGALDDLSDVTLGTPSTGNLLHYNGANWEASSSLMSTLNLGTLRVSGTTGQDYTSFGTLTGTDGGIITHSGNVTAGAMWYHSDTNYDFVANFDQVFLNASESCKLTLVINNDQEGRDTICTGIQFNGFDKLDVQWASGAAPTKGTLGGYDIIEFTVVNNATNSLSNLGETQIQDEVFVFAHHLKADDKLDGDLTGSVFGDDSTLLVDGVNNTIPAANLSGALPAIDGSALTGVTAGSVDFADVTNTPTTIAGYGITDAITDVVSDTTPQLGGNLDLNNNDITGTGNIDITSGNVTLQSGSLDVTGTSTFTGNIVVDQGNDIQIQKSVSANNETLGRITATTGSVEYGEIEFKTGADGFADNSEINWYARIGGAKTAVFEIKGTSLGKSGFEINPTGSASLDFFMQSSGDPTLIFADAGDDRVGFGKIPTQGKVDVDGDVYATTFVGALAFSNLTSTPTTLAGYGITDAATSAQGALADTAVQPAALGNIEFGTGTIDTNDSSAVTITPAVIMSSDATVENSLTVTNTITADTVTGKIVATAGTAPTVATEAGEIGEIRFDNTNMYLKCPDGNWRRVALSGLV